MMTHSLNTFTLVFKFNRMPLFSVISGWVYSLRPISINNGKDFFLKITRVVILPLIFVCGAYYVVQSLTSGTNNSNVIHDIWKIIIFPYTFYWYLYSHFIVFILITLIEVNELFAKFHNVIIGSSITTILLILRNTLLPEDIPNYFGLNGVIFILPFFLLGIYIENNDYPNKNSLIFVLTILVGHLHVSWYRLYNYHFKTESILSILNWHWNHNNCRNNSQPL